MRSAMRLEMSMKLWPLPLRHYAFRNHAIGVSLMPFPVGLSPSTTVKIDILLSNSWWWIPIKYHAGSLELHVIMLIRPYARNPNISQEKMLGVYIILDWELSYPTMVIHSFPMLLWIRHTSWWLYRLYTEMMYYKSKDLGTGQLWLLPFRLSRHLW